MNNTKHLSHDDEDSSFNLHHWLEDINKVYPTDDDSIIRRAYLFSQKISQGLTTFYGQSRLELGLEMSKIILLLNLGHESAAACLLSSVTLTPVIEEQIKKEFGEDIYRIVYGVNQQMPQIKTIEPTKKQAQLEKVRKMLLAMATDIRVVIIKLVERLCVMRSIKTIASHERHYLAEETLDIYAPLANRLGIGQLKWELEDLAFYYLDPTTYKTIATLLAERRSDRETRIKHIIATCQEKLDATKIHASIAGRAKHIYSIYLKMVRKNLNYNDIYDNVAIRILVNTVEECYATLSLVNTIWTPILDEFDDYIAHPKPNGYRSIHTAVRDENNHQFEIQIRTKTMHEEAELGVAAHWAYKENKEPKDDSAKIAHLRQLLDWHKEVAKPSSASSSKLFLDDKIYVLTKAGEILDLPQGSTPIDFAYHIHSELGHRCRGAKINKQIASLNAVLKTGDKVEIITAMQGGPSRDWLNPELGFIKTSQAKNKISHWFKQQAFQYDVMTGKQLLERELTKAGISKSTPIVTLARYFNLKNEDVFYAAFNRGQIRLSQIIEVLKPNEISTSPAPHIQLAKEKSGDIGIVDSADLLMRFAKCCKPIPGDAIIGYITQGRGISIHKKNCINSHHLPHKERFIEMNWDNQKTHFFSTDLKIVAENEGKVLHDLTSFLTNEKIDLLSLQSHFNMNQNKIFIHITIQIQHITQLERIVNHIQQFKSVIDVGRLSE